MIPSLAANRVGVAMFALLVVSVGVTGYLTVTQMAETVDESDIQPAANAECHGLECALVNIYEHPVENLALAVGFLIITFSFAKLRSFKS